MQLTLPKLSKQEQVIHQQLMAFLYDKAKIGLSFADFMQAILYQPNLGYYRNGSKKFGQTGDFVTAPEISSLFAKCLAAQIKPVLHHFIAASILEIGAGSGVMAADILLQLEVLQCLPEQYYILEVSGELQQRQYETLKAKVPHLLERVSWWQQLQPALIGVIIANEVLDAMPVTRFHIDQCGLIHEQVVIWEQGLQWGIRSADNILQQAVEDVILFNPECAKGYTSELNLWLNPWFSGISEIFQAGLCILIDYGYSQSAYYHPERNDGTLICHYQHHAHTNPLINLGVQDVSAFVDFTAVANAADKAGFHVAGFFNQADFLINNGLLDEASETLEGIAMAKQAQQIRTLVMPDNMGERFKVMLLTKDYDEGSTSNHDKRYCL